VVLLVQLLVILLGGELVVLTVRGAVRLFNPNYATVQPPARRRRRMLRWGIVVSLGFAAIAGAIVVNLIGDVRSERAWIAGLARTEATVVGREGVCGIIPDWDGSYDCWTAWELVWIDGGAPQRITTRCDYDPGDVGDTAVIWTGSDRTICTRVDLGPLIWWSTAAGLAAISAIVLTVGHARSLRRRGKRPVLSPCPDCGRVSFDGRSCTWCGLTADHTGDTRTRGPASPL
jgi:hypothetical protein